MQGAGNKQPASGGNKYTCSDVFEKLWHRHNCPTPLEVPLHQLLVSQSSTNKSQKTWRGVPEELTKNNITWNQIKRPSVPLPDRANAIKTRTFRYGHWYTTDTDADTCIHALGRRYNWLRFLGNALWCGPLDFKNAWKNSRVWSFLLQGEWDSTWKKLIINNHI